jgi:hypothetical protein
MEELIQQFQALKVDVDKRLPSLEKKVKDIDNEQDDLTRQVGKKKAKIAMPPRYSGDPLKLTTWIAQCRAYFDYYDNQFEHEADKALFAGALLDGTPAMWFQPALDRYTRTSNPDTLDEDDRKLFDSFEGFEEAIQAICGEPDGKRRAEQRLIKLKQTGSAAALVGQYRAIHPQTDLNDAAVMMLFYLALKPSVQRRLAELDRPDSINEYYEMAVKIDNSQFAFMQEQKAFKDPKANTGKKVQHKSTSYGQHAGPMDIGAAQVGGRKKFDKSQLKCHNCGDKGHFARECKKAKKPKQLEWKPAPGNKAVGKVDKNLQFKDVAAASYTQSDLDDAMDRAALEDEPDTMEVGWNEEERRQLVESFILRATGSARLSEPDETVEAFAAQFDDDRESTYVDAPESVEGDEAVRPPSRVDRGIYVGAEWAVHRGEERSTHPSESSRDAESPQEEPWAWREREAVEEASATVGRNSEPTGIDTTGWEERIGLTPMQQVNTTVAELRSMVNRSTERLIQIAAVQSRRRRVRVEEPRQGEAGPSTVAEPRDTIGEQLGQRAAYLSTLDQVPSRYRSARVPASHPLAPAYRETQERAEVYQLRRDHNRLTAELERAQQSLRALRNSTRRRSTRAINTVTQVGQRRSAEEEFGDRPHQQWDSYWRHRSLYRTGLSTNAVKGRFDQAEYVRLEGDTAELDPRNVLHWAVPFFDCFDHECLLHATAKFEWDFWPYRLATQPIHSVFTDAYEPQGPQWFNVFAQRERNGIKSLRYYPKRTMPAQCAQLGRYRDCPSPDCQVHMKEKVRAWHDRRNQAVEVIEDQLEDPPRRRGMGTWRLMTQLPYQVVGHYGTLQQEGRLPMRARRHRYLAWRMGNASGPSRGPVDN